MMDPTQLAHDSQIQEFDDDAMLFFQISFIRHFFP